MLILQCFGCLGPARGVHAQGSWVVLGHIEIGPGDLVLSEHARKRCQQRGVTDEIIRVVYGYGTVVEHGGSKKFFMDKRARGRAERGLGHAAYKRLVDRLNVYLVINGDLVVTVARVRNRVRVSKPHKPSKPRRRRTLS